MSGLLTRAGYDPVVEESIKAGKVEATKLPPGAVIVTAMRLSDGTARDLINWLKEENYGFPVIAIVENLNNADVVSIMRGGGAVDVIIIRKTKRATLPERKVRKLKRNVRQKQNEAYHRCAFLLSLFLSVFQNFRPGFAGFCESAPGSLLPHLVCIFERPPKLIRRPFFSCYRFSLWVAARPLFRFGFFAHATSVNALNAATLCALTILPRKARRDPTYVYAFDASLYAYAYDTPPYAYALKLPR